MSPEREATLNLKGNMVADNYKQHKKTETSSVYQY